MRYLQDRWIPGESRILDLGAGYCNFINNVPGAGVVLQPNFRFCYNTYFDDYTHLQIFADRSLLDLLAVYGFEARTVLRRFLPVNMKSTLRLRLPLLRQLVKLYLRLPFRPLAGQMLLVCTSVKPE